jgi:hypothetical protein
MSPFCPCFTELDDEHIARRLAEICSGRAHEPRRLAKFPQFSVGHLRQPLTQWFDVQWPLRRQMREVGHGYPFAFHSFKKSATVFGAWPL